MSSETAGKPRKLAEDEQLDDSWFRMASPELARLRAAHARAGRKSPEGEDELRDSWFS